MASNPVGLMPPPDGVIPDFNIHHLTSTQHNFIAAYSITFFLAVVTLALRLYTRIFVIKGFGLDDILIILAMGMSMGFFGVSMEAMKYGFGRHLYEITEVQMVSYTKYLVGLIVTYIWSPALTKLSFLVLLHRLNPTPWFRSCVYGLAFIILGYTIAIIVILTVPCNPTNPVVNAECLNGCGLWQAILSIATDFLSIALPIRMIFQLKLPMTQKAVLAGIFSTSVFVIIVCIVRLTFVVKFTNNADVGYTQARAAVWSCVELNIGIVCACVIVLKPFVRRHFPSAFSSYMRSSDNKSGGRDGYGARTPVKKPFPFEASNSDFNLTQVGAGNEDGSGLSSGDEQKCEGREKGGIVITRSVQTDVQARGGGRGRRNAETESTEDMAAPSRNFSHV